VPFHQSSEDEVRLATAFQEAAYTAGVPTPQVRLGGPAFSGQLNCGHFMLRCGG
jgi:hypothetical protein